MVLTKKEIEEKILTQIYVDGKIGEVDSWGNTYLEWTSWSWFKNS